MKSKLLKKLRAKFKVEYFPSTKQYKVSGGRITYHNTKDGAVNLKEYEMKKYARLWYEKYSKRTKIN